MQKLMLSAAPRWTAAGAAYDWSTTLAARFTWADRYEEEYAAFREQGAGDGGRPSTIILPREVCPLGEDRRAEGLPARFDVDFEPRNAEQARVVKEATELLRQGRSFILQAGTGFGKTALSMPLINLVGRKTLVVVPKTDLIKGSAKRQQWWEHVRDMLGVPEKRIGIWRGNTVQVAGKDVVIAVLHSMGKVDRYPEDLFSQFGLVIFDEVHRLAAEQFNQAAFNFPAKIRLGLSAEPHRKDGRDKLIKAHLGPVAVVAKMVPMSPKVLRYRVEMSMLETIRHTPTRNGHVLKIVERNLKRNKLIAHLAGLCRRKGRNVVVFCHSKEHIETLIDLVRAEGVKSRDIGCYIHGADLEKASTRPVVFATYGMVATGTNCPWWDAGILAGPKGDAKQAVGRILREMEGKKQPVIMDIIDESSELFTDWALGRTAYYTSREVGGEVIDLENPIP